MVAAELDKALPPVMTSLMPKHIPGVEIHTVDGSGHWVLWEKTEQCNKLLTNFLFKIDPVSSSSKL
jgi:soluble epoxide hydrolase/lipid-phosphate phosphatase